MTNSNQNKNKEIIFPEDSDLIISKILEKHNLEETVEKELKKIEKGEKTNGEIITELIKKAAKEKLSFQELTSLLKTELNISSKKSEELAKDIRKEILLLVESPEISQPAPSAKKEETKKRDIYREPIE